ncbi:MAG: hypothetical protein Q8P95_03200 [bacterium]|nr:hypothetical protein [bacterium]
MRFLRLKSILVLAFAVFFVSGGYVGYLSALVDMDEQVFLQEVSAADDVELLKQQLARAKSIADARRRAYLRRRDEFIAQQQAETSQLGHQELVVVEASLSEEEDDLTFFEDQVEVVTRLIEQNELEEDYAQMAPVPRLSLAERIRVSRSRIQIKPQPAQDSLSRIGQLLDKRKELLVEQKQALTGTQYWQHNPKAAPSEVAISVYDKGGRKRSIEPLHTTQIATALSIMPADFLSRIQKVYIVYGDDKMRRGMSGVGVVFMKGELVDFFTVLVHEFGHIFDLHREVASGSKSNFFDGQYRLLQEDPSVTYYEHSWRNNHERLGGDSDFASGYAMSDPFEDFAETFALYVLQHPTFAQWAQSSEVMARKFAFLKGDVFAGRTFSVSKRYSARPYDVTKMLLIYQELLEDV